HGVRIPSRPSASAASATTTAASGGTAAASAGRTARWRRRGGDLRGEAASERLAQVAEAVPASTSVPRDAGRRGRRGRRADGKGELLRPRIFDLERDRVGQQAFVASRVEARRLAGTG